MNLTQPNTEDFEDKMTELNQIALAATAAAIELRRHNLLVDVSDPNTACLFIFLVNAIQAGNFDSITTRIEELKKSPIARRYVLNTIFGGSNGKAAA